MENGNEPATKRDFELLKHDIDALRGEVKQDMDALRGEMKQDMSVLRAELKQDMSVLRAELKQESAMLRSEMRHIADDMKEAMRDMQTEMLNAFYGATTSTNLRLAQSESNDIAIIARLGTLESRVTDLERKSIIPNQQ